jgi:colanic acid biosynthesis glycosyl transferase WcaI
MRRELAKLSDQPADRIGLFPNWVDTDRIYPLPKVANILRLELGLDHAGVICLYSGNMGEKHGVESLASAALLLKTRRDIRFVFCGAGAARDRVVGQVADLPNVAMLPLQPEDRLNELLNLADVHLLPQKADTTSYAMPSKLGPMLASGRPVVAQAIPGSEIAKLVAPAGFVVPPGDAQATARAIVQIAAERAATAALGTAGRQIATSILARSTVLSSFEYTLQQLAKPCQVESAGRVHSRGIDDHRGRSAT